jgi:hypothetical protein
MPRIAKPHTDECQRMRRQLQEYLNSQNITANKLSQLAGVGQPTVSRFLGGRTKSVTPEVSKVLIYAGIDRKRLISGIGENPGQSRLREALERNWDGTAEGADKLAVLIDTMGPMLRSMRLDCAATKGSK